MCGICGIARWDGPPPDPEAVRSMTRALVHRGPDEEGFYSGPEGAPACGFGFRRLSIIDLAGGHQPMRLGSRVIVFNGEIYNYRELRAECEQRGARFRTQSDTEVILHLYADLRERLLERLNGMFAFAIWDESERSLFAARDRMGIKPFYYARSQGAFAFASEMKSLFRSRLCSDAIDRTALADFYRYRFVPAPHTLLKDVRKLRPGHFLRVSKGKFEEIPYWQIRPAPPRAADPSQAEEELAALLDDSVRLQMVSDVPVGAFLSGGVDSSLIAALMRRHTPQKVRTFSIGFEQGTGVDESAHARRVAQVLGTDHHEFVLREKDLVHSEKIFRTMNEPVADPTVLPTAILSRFARQHVKVVLTGEGGDELFAGYNRYKSALFSDWARRFPPAAPFLRRAGKGESFRAIPGVRADNWFSFQKDFSEEKIAALLQFPPEDLRRTYLEPMPDLEGFQDTTNAVLELERRTALPDRLLMKVDMASMSESLEARPPYLDHRVPEFAASLPASLKIRFFKGKHLLRRVAARFLPRDIACRRKHGFIVPIGRWVLGHSRDWLESVLLDGCRLDWIARSAVQNKIENIYNKKSEEEVSILWPLIVLSLWMDSLKNDS